MKTAHFTLGLLAVLPAAAVPRPNVLWIMTDQHSYDAMSCAGNPHLHTPNIDRLASAGVLFPNTYCSFPLSGPSRAAMFTGYMPSETGMVENEMPLRDSLRNDVLGEVVARSGYDCVYAGKWHVNTVSLPSEHSFGFRRLHPMGDEGLAESCVSYLEGRKEGDAPFFLVASFVNPHNICEAARHQILPDADIDPSPKAKRPPLPRNFRVNRDDASVLRFEKGRNYALYPSSDFSRDDWREYRDSYYRLVEAVDAHIGKIVDAVDRMGLWENTVIIFTADHGDGEGAHQWNQKTALYEEVVSVPLIVCLPGGRNAGMRSMVLVNNGIDMMPSICEWTGAEMPSGRSGRSFAGAAVAPEAPQDREYVITETNFNQTAGTLGWMVRSRDYKYVLYDKGLNREQLFDMRKDRAELHNLAGKPAYREVLEQHRAWLRKEASASLGRRAAKILY